MPGYSFNTPAKAMGCLHGAFGGLLLVFGIVARIQVHHWTSIMLIGVWTGVVMLSTGAIAVVAAYRRMDRPSKKCYIITFVVMSFISILMALIVVICYAMAVNTFLTGEMIGQFSWYSYDEQYSKQIKHKAKAITIIILLLGILELFNAVISFMHGLLCCCSRKWHQQKHHELRESHHIGYANEAASS